MSSTASIAHESVYMQNKITSHEKEGTGWDICFMATGNSFTHNQVTCLRVCSGHHTSKKKFLWEGQVDWCQYAFFQVKALTAKIIQTNLPGSHIQSDRNYNLSLAGKEANTTMGEFHL